MPNLDDKPAASARCGQVKRCELENHYLKRNLTKQNLTLYRRDVQSIVRPFLIPPG